MSITMGIGCSLAAVVVGAVLYFEISARKRFKRLQLAEHDPDKPLHIPYPDPLWSIFKGLYDLFTGRSIRGESIDRVCRELLTKDNNGSQKLRWNQSYFLGIHFVSTWDADSVREVLFAKDDVVGKQDFGQEINKKFVSDSILNVEGEEWKRQKKLLSPAFAHEHLKCITPEIIKVTHHLTAKLATKLDQSLKIHPIMQQATLDIIGKSGFNVHFRALDENNKSHELENYEKLIAEIQNPIHFFTNLDGLLGTKKKLYKLLDQFEEFMISVVEQKRKSIAEKGNEYVPSDILDLLVMGHDSEDGVLNDRQLIHNLNTFFIAGHETTAAAVSSTIHLLADHPEHQERLYAEISRVCGANDPTYDDLKDMEFLHNCLKEALRLFPPAPVVVRKVKKDIIVNGYHIPAETTLGLFIYTIHHDPRYWDNPDTFDPDRFNDEHKEKRHRYAWIPFVLGPRQCIGNNLAMMEMKIMLISVLQNFKVLPDPKAAKPNTPYMGLVTQPHPLSSIILQKRE